MANFTPNQNDYKNLTPFKTWLLLQINTWGQNNFPFVESDFDELTNYGMMQKLMKALNDVISNENMVEEDMTNLYNAFTELQTYLFDEFADYKSKLNTSFDEYKEQVDGEVEQFETDITADFNELHDFVDNYFDNNFPELVNDKLDEMASDGTLENLLNDAAHLIKSYDTYTELIADSSTFTDGLRLKTLGYRNVNDGGECSYYVRTKTNYDIPDGIFLINISDTLVMEVIKREDFNPLQLGAYGDGIHDDSDILISFFNHLEENSHVYLKNKYAVSKAINLPKGYGITIDGGSFIALSNFNNTNSNAIFYLVNSNYTQPDGFNVPSTGLRLTNITFMCNWNADGIDIPISLNMTIDKCLFLFYKEYGINVYNNNSHDLLINNCQFRGNGYGSQHIENPTNTGISLRAPDSIIKGCVFAYGQNGLLLLGGANLVSDCHFYSHENSGANIKIASFENIIEHCYFDGCSVWLSSSWKSYINNSLFVVANSTEYIVKCSTNTPTETRAFFWIENCVVNDERSDTTNTLNFLTYDNNITNFQGTKIMNIKKIQGVLADKIIMNNPFNDIQINDIIPSFLGLKKYVASVNTSTGAIGTFTEIDGSSQYYKASCSGNTLDIEFIGASDFSHWLVVPFYVTEKTRIIAELIASSTTNAYIYDENHTFIGQKKATLDAGLYYIAVYKTVSRCILNINNNQ